MSALAAYALMCYCLLGIISFAGVYFYCRHHSKRRMACFLAAIVTTPMWPVFWLLVVLA